jgi:uncharacterized membrane protein (DUF485 family)
MTDTAVQSDKAIGFGLLFGMLSLAGALVMYVAADQQVTAGWGFALAMLAAALSITAIHVYRWR